MDDQARRAPKKTDHTMIEAFGKRWGSHSSFKVGAVDRSGFPTFTINHFNGPVTYSAEGFLDRNLDSLNPDFVSLLRGNTTSYEAAAGGEGSGSSNPFVRGLFSGKQLQRGCTHVMRRPLLRHNSPSSPCVIPRLDGRAVRRAPTLGDVEEKERDDDDTAPTTLNNSSPCVAGGFRSALNTLFETLEETQNVVCLLCEPERLAAGESARGSLGQGTDP